ncbi:MAG: UDP-diphosphatase [Candidatus Methanogaster sp.]|uniref:UDP-diphosphatase n=1 Tax=Candidatus Methanogaster sp. TaxID=3386292 RepID=A0AC61KZY0_9EURY|nr:MAG: UDP-diphosphatase [ANME-2 cluster archaeon]
MDPIQAAILGIIQGVTEWLPVSSEGQSILVMVQHFAIPPEDTIALAIFLHLGTMCAVLIKFRKEFLSILRPESRLLRILVITAGCSGITGIPCYLALKQSFTSGEGATIIIGVMLILTGIVLHLPSRRSAHRTREEITTRDLAITGLVQGFAILPGISRSGVTITTLLLRNIEQKTALTISFLISVPVVLGAMLLDIGSISEVQPANILIMFVTSFVAGYTTMDLLIRFAERVNFALFCITLGAITIVLSVPGVL